MLTPCIAGGAGFRLSLDHVVPHGIAHQVRAPLHTEDFHNPVLVKSHCPFRNVEYVTDLFHAFSFGDQLKNFTLAPGELIVFLEIDVVLSVAEKPKKLAAQFYVTLQRDVSDWLALGVTKTGMVYRLKGNEPQSHE
jgi:hypothetical protein